MAKTYRADGTEITPENVTAQDVRDQLQYVDAEIGLFQSCADSFRANAAVLAKRAAEADTDEEREKWSKMRNDSERHASEAQAQAQHALCSRHFGRAALRAGELVERLYGNDWRT